MASSSSSHSSFSLFSSILLFSFVSLSSPSSSTATTSSRQASVLAALKQSFTNTEPTLQSWSLSNTNNLCSWTGIKCDESQTLVLELDVSNFNLSGSLSPVISQLETLTRLSIAGNSLSGDLWRSLSNLSSLAYLNISNNQFNESLLDMDFLTSASLEVFDAYNNDLVGSLPLSLTKLERLRHLDLGGNYFSGKIPPEYGNFAALNFLSLAGNDLRGFIPPELGNLTSLKQLYLGYYNKFDGGVPPELGKLENLLHLDLSSCGLQGEIPWQLGNLGKLDTLYLQANQLTGTIPHQLGNLTSLRFLDLSNNALTGDLPKELAELKQLRLINLFINRFHGEIPEFIAERENLQVLKLWQNNFTGAIPARLGKNGMLRELDLSTNKLTGTIPNSLCYGRKLEILILLNNFLFGSLPPDLGDCITLSRLRLQQNYLSGSIPRGLLYLPNLQLVELENNFLAGKISEEPTKRPARLGQLILSNNQLTGPLPVSFGNFSGLQILLLSGNQLTGEIPLQLGRLRRLLKIDLSSNNFTGSIPEELGDCLLLTYLDLSHNRLTGPIPAQLSQIKILNYFNVSWNLLNQSIPKDLGSMNSLTSADFSHNNFSGRIPSTGQFAFFNFSSFVANPQLCGLPTNPCNPSSTTPSLAYNKHGGKPQVSGKFKLLLAIGLLFCSVVFVVMVAVKTKSIIRQASEQWKLTAFQKLNFTSKDIVDCLKENCVIGRGGSGIVYRGTMPTGEQVAVKKLVRINNGSSHDNGFSAEIQTLGKIRHRNIVRLLAFCSNKETKLLVYEFMPNGSLGEVLHGKRGAYLSWQTRLKIAVEAARGLCYLHHDCCPPILHRDVKSNNILLDGDLEVHVADFGLAKFLRDTGTSECMSAIAGSYGYIAPEYAYTLKVDEKSDVYSFGVVLLELITGRKPVGDFGEEGVDIVQWCKINTNCNKENVARVLDRRLTNVPVDEAMQVYFVAMLCVEEHSVQRPAMREVVQMLEQAKNQSSVLLSR